MSSFQHLTCQTIKNIKKKQYQHVKFHTHVKTSHVLNNKHTTFQHSVFQHFKIQKFSVCFVKQQKSNQIKHFKLPLIKMRVCCSKIQTSKVQTHNMFKKQICNFQIAWHGLASILKYHKKRKVATKTIPYETYGEILFQKVALCYLLHFVQDGSSKNALDTFCFAHQSQKRESYTARLPFGSTKKT